MIFDFPQLIKKHNMNITGIIHVGAHEAGEIYLYSSLGIKDVVLIEANPERYNNLLHTIRTGRYNTCCTPLTYSLLDEDLANITKNYIVYNFAIYHDNIGDIEFNLTSADGGADSIYRITEKGSESSWCKYFNTNTIKVQTETLDNLIKNKHVYNFLNIDVEGAELDVLKGSINLLNNIDYILCETQYSTRFKDSSLHSEIEEFLNSYGFYCVDKTDTYHNLGWGDALFVKQK